MLILTRKVDEKIVIDDEITLMVIDIRGDRVRLGIDAPKRTEIHRQEVWAKINTEAKQANSPRMDGQPGKDAHI